MNPDLIYRHIGEVISNQRRASKPRVTQEELAKRVGISRASLANIETGRQSVLVHQLYAIAEALGLEPSDFLLPADNSRARDAWDEMLPENLNSGQKAQIARLLADTNAEPTRDQEENHAPKQRKR